MKVPHTTLEQWQVLQAIVENGSFSKAAEALHRSQSSVSYMVANLQEQLGVELLRIEGRKAKLTEAGAELLREAGDLLDGARRLEERARHLNEGWEPEINFVVDSLLPREILARALLDVGASCPQSRVQLKEVVLSGADEAIASGDADVVIAGNLPTGVLGDPLMEIEFIAVAHPEHRLHKLGRPLGVDDLAGELQIVVRDSGTRNPRDDGWLGAARRWTVSSGETKTAILAAGMGFGWQPRHAISRELANGSLKPLPLLEGQRRKRTLFLIFPKSRPGPGAQRFAAILRKCVKECPAPKA